MGVFDALPASLYRRALYEDRLACVLRAGHPDAAALDLDGYLALRHIAVTISGVGASPVDAALSARGLTRRVALRVPHFLAAAMMTADSDMALTLPGDWRGGWRPRWRCKSWTCPCPCRRCRRP